MNHMKEIDFLILKAFDETFDWKKFFNNKQLYNY